MRANNQKVELPIKCESVGDVGNVDLLEEEIQELYNKLDKESVNLSKISEAILEYLDLVEEAQRNLRKSLKQFIKPKKTKKNLGFWRESIPEDTSKIDKKLEIGDYFTKYLDKNKRRERIKKRRNSSKS